MFGMRDRDREVRWYAMQVRVYITHRQESISLMLCMELGSTINTFLYTIVRLFDRNCIKDKQDPHDYNIF
jgi:hypothetical protein